MARTRRRRRRLRTRAGARSHRPHPPQSVVRLRRRDRASARRARPGRTPGRAAGSASTRCSSASAAAAWASSTAVTTTRSIATSRSSCCRCELSTDSSYLERFLAEAKSAARLQHANAAAIYEVGQQDGQYYLAMELITGGSVEERLARRRPHSAPGHRRRRRCLSRPAGGACGRHRPPRHQAGESALHRGRRGQGGGLRSRQADSSRGTA